MEHRTSNKWTIVSEEERKSIERWRDTRLRSQTDSKPFREFLQHSFTLQTLKSFLQNINVTVILNVALAIIAVAIFQSSNVYFDVSVGLFVAPVVFPLAFSINSDFNRREKVLEDLASFKSSGLLWYFSMREWKRASGLDTYWMNSVYRKLKSLSYHLREYLLTGDFKNRRVILRAMYEDFSDASQLIEKVRASRLPGNSAIISRSIHLLHVMSTSFERLRVIREYRSPQSIRSFNKIFVMILPIIIAPYFVYLGVQSRNHWAPYYVAIPVAIVFSVLQGVQDKLDDPFDGIGEDDINLDTIEEWALDAFGYPMKRFYDTSSRDSTSTASPDAYMDKSLPYENVGGIWRTPLYNNMDHKKLDYHRYAPMFEGIKGMTRIARRSIHKTYSELIEDRSTTRYHTNSQTSHGNKRTELPDNDSPNGVYSKSDRMSSEHLSSNNNVTRAADEIDGINKINSASVVIDYDTEPISVDHPIEEDSTSSNKSKVATKINDNERNNDNEVPDFIGHIKKFYAPYPLPTDFVKTENTCWI